MNAELLKTNLPFKMGDTYNASKVKESVEMIKILLNYGYTLLK